MSKICIYGIIVQLSIYTLVFATDGHAQNKGVDEIKLSLSLTDSHTSLDQVIEEIEKSTNFIFSQIDQELNTSSYTLSISSRDYVLGDLLREIARQTDLSFQRVNEYIQIRKREIGSEPVVEVIEQAKTVSGNVTDENGEPLPGATVAVKGTASGTITDVDGHYSLQVPEDAQSLVFSFVGYKTQEVALNGQTVINVSLEVDFSSLDEVVVIGYGAVKKSDLTGSVASVKSEEINAYPSSNVLESMTGRAAGVQVLRNTGAPGGNVSIRIRGTNSIEGDNEPLYVLDGFPLSGQPNNLNNSEIESVEILKDASATAIYGSRGANGVVLITTKGGNSGETRIDFNSSFSVQSLRKRLVLMNASEYAQLANIQAANDNVAPYFTQEEINNYGTGTDWQDVVFQNAPLYNNSLSINGGDQKTQFSLGGSIFNQEGIVRGSDFNRYSARAKINHDVTQKLRIDFSAILSKTISDRKDNGGGARGNSLINAAITAPPTISTRNEDGVINDLALVHPFVAPDMTNPLYFLNELDWKINENIVLGTSSLNYELLPGLLIKILGGIESSDRRTDLYESLEFRNSNGRAEVSTENFTSLLNENTLNFNKVFNSKNTLSVVAGFTFQNFRRSNLNVSGSGFLDDVFQTYDLGAANTPGLPESGYSESTLLSYLARLNYSLNEKYLFTLSFRADGSSRFSQGNKWGYFPSAAIAWRISEEHFLQNNDLISDWKLRGSWGLTGSQAIDPYTTLNRLQSAYTVFNDQLYTTFSPGSRLPEDLKWETTEQFDIGTEVGIFDGRFYLTMDYYIKNTRDLLNTVTLPSSIGYTSTIRNVGHVRNTGVELGIDATLVRKNQFAWDVLANATFNRNEVLQLANNEDVLTNPINSLILVGNSGILREGRPIGQFYGYFEDDYSDEGVIKYKDLNEDGVISEEDQGYIGNPNPDVIFGLNSNTSYRNLSLSLFFQGTIGNDIFNLSAASSTLDYGQGLNGLKEVLTNHWTSENPNAKYPKISRQASYKISDRFIEDGSYVRLKNIELAYSFPQNEANQWFRSLQVYGSAQNLLTITGYSWWDPEVNSTGLDANRGVDYFSYPNAKSFTIGLRAGF